MRNITWRRWTIAGLLFLMLCAAGYFTGFRFGLSDGLETQVESRIAERQWLVYPKAYRVTDLIRPSAEPTVESITLDSLADEIRSSVSPRQWVQRGGPCTLATQSPDTIVISASNHVHELVASFLVGRRQSNPAAHVPD